MRSGNPSIERIVKSFGFSVALFLLWGALTVSKARSLFERFEWLECAWLLYNATLAILFLIRTRPSVVSLNPLHWLVALLTSFSGLFFRRADTLAIALPGIALALTVSGLMLSFAAALGLGRSYDFLPALRGLQTRWVYRFVRHPMYLASILIRLGYLAQNPLAYNAAVSLAMIWLYDLRARYEESIMANDARYNDYCSQVRFRFVPFVY